MWLYDKDRVWKLKYHRWRFDVWYAAEHKKLLDQRAQNQDFAALEAEEQFTLGEIQDQIDLIRSSALFRKAYDYDVELPPMQTRLCGNIPTTVRRYSCPRKDAHTLVSSSTKNMGATLT